MLDFRLYEPGDMGGCLDLIRSGHDPDFSEERFRWLHERGPAGPSQIALCLRDQEIVGFYSVLPKPFRFLGLDVHGGRDIDPVVHPSCRGQGVFSRLLKFGLENFKDLDVLFNFANPASAVGFRRQGWRDVMTLDDRVRQLGSTSPLSKAGVLYSLGKLNRYPRNDFRISTHDAKAFGEFLDSDSRFAEPDVHPFIGGVHRSASYLKWRYLDHPLHQYLYFTAEDGTGGVAVAICRYEKAAERLSVVDLVGFGMTPLICFWLPLWEGMFPLATVVAWRSLTPETLTGLMSNPTSRGKGRPFLVRQFPGGQATAHVLESGYWMITRGDLEIA